MDLTIKRSGEQESVPTTGSTSTPTTGRVQRKSLRQMSYSSGLAALSPVQAHGGAAGAVHEHAAHGISGSSGALPHLDAIQASFGRHDVSGVQAHTDAKAAAGAAGMGADAYATGNHVAFGGAPDLHTAAHEAAHVVQQRAGVQLSGGVGQVGDSYERHADSVADAVVAGRSAEGLLDQMAPGAGGGGSVQRSVQMRGGKAAAKYSTPDWSGLATTRKHVMEGEINSDGDPTGLHAYAGGSLPGGVEVLRTVGSTGGVHLIWWTKGTAKRDGKAKWSSMFPDTFTEGMVTAVFQKEKGQSSNIVDCAAMGLPSGGTITVGKSGNTLYPIGSSAAERKDTSVTKGEKTYRITNAL